MKLKIIGLTALFAIIPLSSVAAATGAGVNAMPTDTVNQQSDDSDEFPWGLLGLLGLAGLLGRKRDDHQRTQTTARS